MGSLGFVSLRLFFFFLRPKRMQTFPDVENNKTNDKKKKKKQKEKKKKRKKNHPHQTGQLGEEGNERKIKNQKKALLLRLCS